MASYQTFTTVRTTAPDPIALAAAVKTATGDPTAVMAPVAPGWRAKKAGAWSAGDMAAVQTALDTTAALTPQLAAQQFVDQMSIYDKARDLTIIDQLNIMRAALRGLGVTGIPDITPAQAITAIRNKAATL